MLKDRVEYILKHNLLVQKLFRAIMNSVFKLLGLFVKTDESLVLISSYGGSRYNDSPRVISDYLLSHHEYDILQIVWAFGKPENFGIANSRIKKIKIDSPRYFYTALRAKYWVSCVSIERGLHFKKAGTRYLNTWHGIPIKKIGNGVAGRKDFDFSNVDVFCYSGTYEKEIYLRDLGTLEKNMILCGMPRNDELYMAMTTREKGAATRQKLGLPAGKKIILYAPTWRESRDGGKTYVISPPLDIALLENHLAKEYVMLFRMHHFTNTLQGVRFSEFIRDVSDYPDINELLMATDILVSDYSAVIFDFAILERPIICFGYDCGEYTSDRGFYLDLEREIPGGIVKNQEELIQRIVTMKYDAECAKVSLFKKKYLEQGGNATETCVKALFGDKEERNALHENVTERS